MPCKTTMNSSTCKGRSNDDSSPGRGIGKNGVREGGGVATIAGGSIKESNTVRSKGNKRLAHTAQQADWRMMGVLFVYQMNQLWWHEHSVNENLYM